MQFLVFQVPPTVFLKVADYAKTIEREAENVLGAKGGMMSAFNHPNAKENQMRKALADPVRNWTLLFDPPGIEAIP